ncbi:MAG: hypothetical protein ACYSR7_01615 [Planctomycetota bacterium]
MLISHYRFTGLAGPVWLDITKRIAVAQKLMEVKHSGTWQTLLSPDYKRSGIQVMRFSNPLFPTRARSVFQLPH